MAHRDVALGLIRDAQRIASEQAASFNGQFGSIDAALYHQPHGSQGRPSRSLAHSGRLEWQGLSARKAARYLVWISLSLATL